MNYIIFDLEFNQAYTYKNKTHTVVSSKCPFEIIQIGALKLDDNLNEISTFNALVKPKLYTKIHPFVAKITNITTDDLQNAQPFHEVYNDFSTFVGGSDNILCIWGMSDMKELFRNILFHNLDTRLMPKKYINVQDYTSKYLKTPNNSNVGLQNAIDLLNIKMDKSFHDAFNDAYYTAEIFKKLQIDSLEPEKYSLSQIRRSNRYRQRKSKKKIDKHGLIKQFEKMHDRKMTREEISMITLAYKMGLTHQFQIDDKGTGKK